MACMETLIAFILGSFGGQPSIIHIRVRVYDKNSTLKMKIVAVIISYDHIKNDNLARRTI